MNFAWLQLFPLPLSERGLRGGEGYWWQREAILTLPGLLRGPGEVTVVRGEDGETREEGEG